MKKCISVFAFAILFLVSGKALQAQNKVAHVYLDSLVADMPEKGKADSAIKKVIDVYENYYKKKEAELVAKTKQAQEMIDINKGVQPTGDPTFELLVKDINELQTAMQTIQQEAETKINAKQLEVYEPIIKRAKEAINAIAKEKGYSLVLDAGVGNILYSQPGDNIINDVRKKLGIK